MCAPAKQSWKTRGTSWESVLRSCWRVPKERERERERERAPGGLTLCDNPSVAFDQHQARRITRAAKEYMREHQPPGYRPTPEENQAFQELRTRRSVAKFREDLEAVREANTALVVRTLESYARHNAELDEHGPTT
jgi:hypothetical protein